MWLQSSLSLWVTLAAPSCTKTMVSRLYPLTLNFAYIFHSLRTERRQGEEKNEAPVNCAMDSSKRFSFGRSTAILACHATVSTELWFAVEAILLSPYAVSINSMIASVHHLYAGNNPIVTRLVWWFHETTQAPFCASSDMLCDRSISCTIRLNMSLTFYTYIQTDRQRYGQRHMQTNKQRHTHTETHA